ncbi:hypothetical protein CWI75_03455 [Kineobactrum sediminis]|uniref:Methyl-accepting transducer domain-containing protein n=1 Tax=Kineobactrum sediminis TaxID=1905677 RepID=A0A2N5Y7P2_9GAMM|nr:methyl-accepting chemotaxis protein [Kineobactrum sediminis]PLW84408.1 hypothetical protein CWI75_03455 [Kineobactrum sediminis]
MSQKSIFGAVPPGLAAVTVGILLCLAGMFYALGLMPAGSGAASEWAALRATIMGAAGVLLVSAVIALALLWRTFREGNQPTAAEGVNSALRKIAEGDLTTTASGDSPTTAAIAEQLNNATARQRELIHNIRAPFETIATEIHKLGRASAGQSQTSAELARQLHDAAAALARSLQGAEDIKSASGDVVTTSNDYRQRVARSHTLSRDMSRAAVEVRESVQATSKSAKRQGELIQSVSTAAEYIQSLNTKISVVAINTRIEAERAGEYGRPFLGIAEAIADLLREAEEEGRKITAEVRMLQGLSAENLHSMENTVGAVVTILEFVERIDGALEDINRGAGETARIITSLAERSGQSTASALELESLLDHIREQNLSLGQNSELAQKSVGVLQQTVAGFARNLGRFKIDDTGSGGYVESFAQESAVAADVPETAVATRDVSAARSRAAL